MTHSDSTKPVPVGIDDGYACIKVALPDGRLSVIPSRARAGRSGITWIHQGQQHVFDYETDGTIYAVGAVDGDPTQFESYPSSGLNRVLVQHALQEAGLTGRTVHAVSGLPVSAYYDPTGKQRRESIDRKVRSLKRPVSPVAEALPAGIAFVDVIPEALAAWYDCAIEEKGGNAALNESVLSVPLAIVDIGGRTTDYVVIKDQAILHGSSGSLQCGMLDVKQRVAAGVQARFDLEALGEQTVASAIETQTVRLRGKDYGVSELVDAAKREVVERIHAETRHKLGLGVELDRILFVGGGTVALAEHIVNWFPHQHIAEHPAFANARGMLKYLRYVCESSDAA